VCACACACACVRFEGTKHKRVGELCFIKYCQIFVNRRYGCLDRVFLTQ